ncbi:MAG: hypothetical protein FWD13_03565 [Treponema sp.]|nr:hypothetical protein [Treponema sp.]
MGRKKTFHYPSQTCCNWAKTPLFIIITAFLVISCVTTQEPNQAIPEEIETTQEIIQEAAPEIVPEPAAEVVQEIVREVIPEPVKEEVKTETFDPARISQEYYISTRDEVQQFIERLNQVIRSRNYEAWRAALSPEYFSTISSPENLRHISELPAMRTRNIVLRTPQDYFIHVVVPSRANSRVDDIEFVTMNRVNAFTINPNGQRLSLYALEKIGNSWTIINN